MKKNTPLPAKITVGIATIGIIMTSFGVIKENGAVVFAGMALTVVGFIASFVVSAIMSVKSKSENPQYVSKSVTLPSNIAAMPLSADPIISRILANPYVLLDERIRQLHEVQNLLQYPEIQQIFFEPEKLYSLFERDRVGELMNIVSGWITRNNAAEIFAAAEKLRPTDSPAGQSNKQRTKPAKKNTTAFAILFIAVWLVIFIAIFSSVLSRLH